jgi:hypothetical protein
MAVRNFSLEGTKTDDVLRNETVEVNDENTRQGNRIGKR